MPNDELILLSDQQKPKNRHQVTKSDVEHAKNLQKIQTIARRGKLASFDEWIGFGVAKVLGLGGIGIGGLEWLDPNLLPIVLEKPEYFVGAGLALLIGRKTLSLVAKVTKVLEGA